MGESRITLLCIFCFKPASGLDGNHEGAYSPQFLQFFSRFLEIPFKIREQNHDFVSCNDCFIKGESFRNLYFEWEKIRLQLEWSVGELYGIVRAAGRVPSRVREFRNQFENNEEDGDDSNKVYYDIQKLRKEILRGCKKKLNSSFPRVALEKIPKEDEIDVNQPVDSFENFKLLHRMMTFIAVFQLSLPQPVTNLDKDNDRVPPTTSTFPSVETNSNPLHVIESPEVIDAEVYDCASEVSETHDETEVPHSCNEAQTGSHAQQHEDLGGQVYEELLKKEHPKFHLETAQDHHSSEIPGNGTTSNETLPEATGIAFKNTQMLRKLQNKRKVQKKSSRKVSLTFSIRLRCATCKKSFSNRFSLNRHRKTHLDKRRFKCTLCESCFSRKDSLSKHMRKIHRVDNQPSSSSSSLPFPGKQSGSPQISDSRHFHCVTCQKSFSTRYQLTRHSATHSGKRPFKCTCGSCFRTLDVFSKHIKGAYQDQTNHQLVRQLKTKKGERSFNCTTCRASFKWNSSLTRHIKIVHGVDNLHSSETVKNPSLGGELTPPTAIEISNSEQKPEGKFQPDLQQPHSKSSSSLLVPGNLGSTPKISDSRRFRCGSCQKSFPDRYGLTRHSATHSGKRPFKCTCGSGFITKNSFSKHIKEAYQQDKSIHQLDRKLMTQTGEGSFNCATCGASFNRNFSLHRHIAIVHNVEKKVEIQEGMVNQAVGEKTQGKAGSAPEEKKVAVTKGSEELLL